MLDELQSKHHWVEQLYFVSTAMDCSRSARNSCRKDASRLHLHSRNIHCPRLGSIYDLYVYPVRNILGISTSYHEHHNPFTSIPYSRPTLRCDDSVGFQSIIPEFALYPFPHLFIHILTTIIALTANQHRKSKTELLESVRVIFAIVGYTLGFKNLPPFW